jgi:hypothetical protein
MLKTTVPVTTESTPPLPSVYRLEDLAKALCELLHAQPETRKLPVCVHVGNWTIAPGESVCLDRLQGVVTNDEGTFVGITLG